MIGLESYTSMFNTTRIQYFDKAKHFAYAPFTNRSEQIEMNVMERKAKVIIFDTTTSYVNATQLVDAFKDSEYKRLSDFTKNKHYKDCVAMIQDELNQNRSIDSKYYKLPCYDPKEKCFTAFYLVRQSSKTDGYAGTYVHPDMIIHILAWCNFKLASKISKFITALFLREGANESVTLTKTADDEVDALSEDLEEKQAVIDKINAENRYLNDYVDSLKFDVIQYQKQLSYINDLREENKALHKSLASVQSNSFQMVLVVRHYDKEGRFAYGSKSYRLSLLLISDADLERYLQKYNKQEEQTEEDVEHNIIRYSTEIIYRIPSLRDVAPDFDDKFVSLYEDQIDIWTEKIKNKEYICTTDIKQFQEALSEFCSDWQVV